MNSRSTETLSDPRLRALPAGSGWDGATWEALTGDASTRKYFRLRRADRSVVLMDASRNRESVAPFIRIRQQLDQLGFSVPAVLARDEASGLLLLEDFGDASFARLIDTGTRPGDEAPIAPSHPSIFNVLPSVQSLLASAAGDRVACSPGDPETLFTLATDVLIALHRQPQAIPHGLRAYHPEKMLEDIELFLEWRTPGISETGRAEFRSAWREVLPLAHRVPASLLLRDYHVANLMWLPEREGIRRAGLLDFQDAYRGPVTYDLMSLLEDARRDVPASLKEAMRARYRAQFPGLDRNVFDASCAVMAAQRHTRVLAIFERLSRLEGRHEYRQLHSPRVERLLREALEHPLLTGVKRWMNRHAT